MTLSEDGSRPSKLAAPVGGAIGFAASRRREGAVSMPSAAYFRRRADLLVARLRLAHTDGDPVASRRYRPMALDCLAKARELDIDEFRSRIMPVIREEWHHRRKSGKKNRGPSKRPPPNSFTAKPIRLH